MNTKESAIKNIRSFLHTEDKFILLTGTHQNKKHILILSLILTEFPAPAKILFRANSSDMIEELLEPVIKFSKRPKPGDYLQLGGGYTLYVDTINKKSWRREPYEVDVAIVYPFDSLDYDNGDDCIEDLIRRKTKKIFLITWTDNRDISWVNSYNPVHVIYDAEEEDPEYHKRMTDLLSSTEVEVTIPGLPSYADSIPMEYLIKIYCRGKCNGTRWAKLNKPFPGKSALRNADMGDYKATCLKCGNIASDNYNWHR